MGKELNLPKVASFSNTTDYVRMLVGSVPVDVTPTNFASGIDSLITASLQKLKIRHITSAGSILSTDNVVTCTGTFSVTMPNPSVIYDATNTQSNSITIAMKGSGTVTINPYDSESFLDGGTQASYSLNTASVTFVTDGTDWIVIAA